MRLLHKTSVLLDLPDLGFAARDYALMDELIQQPDGIILVTGPTGSGKTTTLYACLNRINHPNLNILTVEDPVEYELGGIHQVQVHPKIGLTFASALRAFLRQDPDVIMVGEIRDNETAEIAIHASLTGHLVLSTIHTNDAAGAVTRLVEMGIEPFLVRSSRDRHARAAPRAHALPALQGAVRSRADYELRAARHRSRAHRAGATTRKLSPRYVAHGAAATSPIGCEQPRRRSRSTGQGLRRVRADTGYTGRRGIYELLMIDDAVGAAHPQERRRADASSAPRSSQGMDTLRDDGARKVLDGHHHGRRGPRGHARRRVVDEWSRAMAVFEYRGILVAHRQSRSRASATPRTPRRCAPRCARDGILLTLATEESGGQGQGRARDQSLRVLRGASAAPTSP